MNPMFAQYFKTDMKSYDLMKKQYMENLEKKWGPLADHIDGVPDFKTEYARQQFLMVMENTEFYYATGAAVQDTTTTNTTAGTTNANLGIPKILPPILRRVMPDLFVQDLVTIQAIPVPDAKVFFYKAYKADSTEIGDKDNFSRTYANRSTEGADALIVKWALTSSTISAASKALASEWSLELQQDMLVYLNLSAEMESIKATADEIRLELEGDVVAGILASATAGNVNWYDTAPAGDTTSTAKKDYARTIYEAITECNNLIYKVCYVNATWIIGDVDTVSRLEKLEEFKLDESANPSQQVISRQYMGTLKGKFKVYKDPFFATANKLLMGFKSPNRELYSGFIFAPYVPAYLTATVENPISFKFSKGFLTRNGMKMVNGNMYATVTVVSGVNPVS